MTSDYWDETQREKHKNTGFPGPSARPYSQIMVNKKLGAGVFEHVPDEPSRVQIGRKMSVSMASHRHTNTQTLLS